MSLLGRCVVGLVFVATMTTSRVAMAQTRAEYQAIVASEREYSRMKAEFASKKKLCVPADKELSPELPEEHQSLPIAKVNAGDVGLVEFWEFNVDGIVTENQTAITARRGPTFILTDYPNADVFQNETVHLMGLVRIGEPITHPNGRKYRTIRFLDTKEQAERAEAEARAQREKASDEFELKSGETFTARFIEFKNGLFVFEAIDGTRIEKKTAELSTKAVNAIRAKLKAASAPTKKKK